MIMDIRTWIKGKLEIIGFSKPYEAGGFRIGLYYDEGLVEEVCRRIDVAYFWSTDIVYRAFSDGFTIQDKEGEKPTWWDEYHSLNWIDNIIRGAVFERKGGACAFALYTTRKDENDIEREIPAELLPFKRDDTEFEIDKFGRFTKFKLKEHIGGSHTAIDYTIEGDDLDNVFHQVLRPGKYKYQGNSVIEPIWDLLNVRAIILQSSGLISARLAAGLRKATVASRQDKTEDDATVAAMELGLKKLESDDTTITLRSGYDSQGRAWEDKLEIDTGGAQFNYLDKIEIVNQGLSIATGIPANYFKGIFFGSLYASDSILRMLHTTLKKIQFDWTKRIETMIKRWCEIKGYTWDPDLTLTWNLKPKLTEEEEANINLTKANRNSIYLTAGILDTEEVRKDEDFQPHDKVIEKPTAMGIAVSGLNPEEEEENEEPDDKVKT